MKIAIVHDYLNQYGGAERVVETLHELYPEAPIYTTIYLPEQMPDTFRSMDIRTSFMQKFPWLKKHFKKYLIFYPWAIESFNFKNYDLILSSSSGWSKGAKHAKNTLHLCYCYTPMRWVWTYERYVEREHIPAWAEIGLKACIHYLKGWDLRTNNRVDKFIAISNLIHDRIKRCYGLEADVIYPPVETDRFKISPHIENYFLLVSRLNPYKRVDIVVEAFNQLGLPLVIIGEGPDKKYLEKMAKSNIKFLGRVADEVIAEHCSRCQAFIFPGEEDFGIAPVEAMAAGRPVIAFAAGGALETVVEGVTGVFFKEQTPASLMKAVKKMQGLSFDPLAIRQQASKFDKEVFKKELKDRISRAWETFTCRRNIC